MPLEVTLVLTAPASQLTYAEQLAQQQALQHLRQFPNDVITGVELNGGIDFESFYSGTVPGRADEACGTVDDFVASGQLSPSDLATGLQNAQNLGYFKPNWIFWGQAKEYFGRRGNAGGDPRWNYLNYGSVKSIPADYDPAVHNQFVQLVNGKYAPLELIRMVQRRYLKGISDKDTAQWLADNHYGEDSWLDHLIEGLILAATFYAVAVAVATIAAPAAAAGSGAATGAGDLSTLLPAATPEEGLAEGTAGIVSSGTSATGAVAGAGAGAAAGGGSGGIISTVTSVLSDPLGAAGAAAAAAAPDLLGDVGKIISGSPTGSSSPVPPAKPPAPVSATPAQTPSSNSLVPLLGLAALFFRKGF